jgi:hypothetical protein
MYKGAVSEPPRKGVDMLKITICCLGVYVIGIFASELVIRIIERMGKNE